MPFYEYQCGACGAQVEVLQKITDAPLKKCPECGKPKLAKLVSAPVFRLKGAGWYETDFKTDKDSKRNLVDSGKGEAGDPKADAKDAKAETKGEAKAEAKTEAGSESRPESKTQSRSGSKPRRPASRVASRPARKPAAGAARTKKAKSRR